jgi:hypothetical protein
MSQRLFFTVHTSIPDRSWDLALQSRRREPSPPAHSHGVGYRGCPISSVECHIELVEM